MKEAEKRGHRVGTPISWETGYDLRKALDQKAALKIVEKEEPYCLVIAFPCGPFSPLQNLNPNTDPVRLQEKLKDGRALLKFAVKLARLQHKGGRHFILENPLPSAAWKEPELRDLIEELDCFIAELDQCRFGLVSLRGFPHKKPTRLATSSPSVANKLHGRRCLRQHEHDPVLGGVKVTSRAGHYPGLLAKAMVLGLESQFETEGVKNFEVNAAEVEEPEGAEDDFVSGLPGDSESEDDGDEKSPKDMVITAAIRQSVRRLHENTGHRSNRRLARALNLAGAPAEVVWAAKHHQCDICKEKRGPKARRPVSLPTPKECSDQVHIDLVEMYDASEAKHMVVHMTDHATRFQLAEVLPDKSTKSVVSFIKRRWMPIFGPPKVLVADQGREFVSWEMEEFCASASILLWHAAVQAPWQNGVAEKSGGILKTIVNALVTAHSIQGHEEMQDAVGEALSAYNGDINEVGVSPSQAVIGRQPRQVGDVLGGSIQSRLAEHGLSETPGPLARQLALRETAKIAITRLHFSRGLRRAELARSRSSTVIEAPKPGDICYFYRMSKYNSRTGPSKKKLSLRRWHGPALVVALEGSSNAFLSFKGQLTKCSLEHVRPASTMEQIAASTWRDAIEEVVRAAQHDLTLNGIEAGARRGGGDEPGASLQLPEGTQSVLPAAAPGTPGLLLPAAVSGATVSSDLPPVASREVIASLQSDVTAEDSLMNSGLPSRRQSIGTLASVPEDSGLGVASRLASSMSRARELDKQSGVKRTAPVGLADLEAEAGEDVASPVVVDESPVPVCPSNSESDEALMADALPDHHPLSMLVKEVKDEKMIGGTPQVSDHGSWAGRWGLPRRSTWQLKEKMGSSWPKGGEDSENFIISEHEVNVILASRKEYKWNDMSERQKELFREAALTGWNTWVDNNAVSVLSVQEAEEVRQRLRRSQEGAKILQPRYVFTDKNDGLRTPDNPMEIKPSARLVVPGYLDTSAYTIRKDAPTASRVMQHVLFAVTASNFKKGWRLMSADVKSAFLKGDPYIEGGEGSRELFIQNVRRKGDEGWTAIG